jgi:hypothetical protein
MPLDKAQRAHLSQALHHAHEFLQSFLQDEEPEQSQGEPESKSQDDLDGLERPPQPPLRPVPPLDLEEPEDAEEAEPPETPEEKPAEPTPAPKAEESPATPEPEKPAGKKPRKPRGNKSAEEKQAAQEAQAAADREPEPEASPIPAPAGGEQQRQPDAPSTAVETPPTPSNPDELLADARAAAVAYASKHGRQGLREKLNTFTKGNIAEVPQDKLAALIQALRE